MRKLTCAALSYTISVLLMHYLQQENAVRIIVPIFITVAVSAWVMLCGKLRVRVLLASLFVLFGVVRYEVHYNNTVAQFEDYIGLECRITAEVCEYPVIYDDSVKYTVKLDTALLPKVKAVVYDYTVSDSSLRPGDRFRATVRVSSALLSSGEETDTYVSKGIYVRGYVMDEVKQISDGIRIKYAPLYLAESIRSTITQYMPQRSAAFLAALMTGDKTALYADAELNNILAGAGLSHVVAVSGMHVSFVVALAMILFGSRIGWLVSVVFIVLFAIMTGMTPSVLRAVFMQSLFLLAPVLRREADGLTSISFALLILLVLNPFAVSSVGLQLSFLAMAGIILVTPRGIQWFQQKCPFTSDRVLKVYHFITVSLSSSLGATIFTAPLCAYYFGSISVLAPLTNLLVLWLVPICFAGGFLLCVIAAMIPIAAPLVASLLDICVSFVFVAAKWVSSLSISTIYLPETLMLVWFIGVYAIICMMFLFRKNGMYQPIIPIITAVLSLILLTAWVQRNNTGMTVSALDVGQGQCIAVFDGNITMMADCGGDYDSGETAARWLYSHGRKQVDVLILSHFDEDHVNGVSDLILRVPVKEIVYCGNNITADEMPMYNEIREMAEKHNTKLRLVNTEAEMKWGSLYARLFAANGNSSNDGLITYLQSGGYEILIMGDADLSAEKQLLRSPWLKAVDCLVVGHHGSAYSTGDDLLERVNPKLAIISCGYNAYGHPSEEVLDRLAKKNVVIYRTDQMGSIEIKVR